MDEETTAKLIMIDYRDLFVGKIKIAKGNELI